MPPRMMYVKARAMKPAKHLRPKRCVGIVRNCVAEDVGEYYAFDDDGRSLALFYQIIGCACGGQWLTVGLLR